MAIDTAEKRKSAASVSALWLAPGVTPNAGKDQEWRQETAWSYSGILADGAEPEAPSARRKYQTVSVGIMMGQC